MNFITNTRANTPRDAGTTFVTTLAAMVIGVIVIGGYSLFWINSTKSADKTSEVANQEASALRVINGVSGEINSANKILYARGDQIVVERSGNNIVRTRYELDKTTNASNFTIGRSVNKNSPAGIYDADTTFNKDEEGVVWTKTTVAQNVKDIKLFGYFTKSGVEVTGANLNSPATRDTIQRVDIAFESDGSKGRIELSTKSSLGKSTVGGVGTTPGYTNVDHYRNHSHRVPPYTEDYPGFVSKEVPISWNHPHPAGWHQHPAGWHQHPAGWHQHPAGWHQHPAGWHQHPYQVRLYTNHPHYYNERHSYLEAHIVGWVIHPLLGFPNHPIIIIHRHYYWHYGHVTNHRHYYYATRYRAHVGHQMWSSHVGHQMWSSHVGHQMWSSHVGHQDLNGVPPRQFWSDHTHYGTETRWTTETRYDNHAHYVNTTSEPY